MPDEDMIAVGDKIEIVSDEGRSYKTMVEDMTGNGLFLVGMPSYERIPVIFHKGDAFTVHFSRESGIYATYMRVLGFEKKGEIRYIWLHQETRPRKYQRRGAYRLPVNLKVIVYEHAETQAGESLYAENTPDANPAGENPALIPPVPAVGKEPDALETAGARDISVSGLALVVRREYEPNGKILLQPLFNEQTRASVPFIVGAEVVRSIPERHISRHCIGVKFIGQTNSMHDYLSKYVLAGQQKQLRREIRS